MGMRESLVQLGHNMADAWGNKAVPWINNVRNKAAGAIQDLATPSAPDSTAEVKAGPYKGPTPDAIEAEMRQNALRGAAKPSVAEAPPMSTFDMSSVAPKPTPQPVTPTTPTPAGQGFNVGQAAEAVKNTVNLESPKGIKNVPRGVFNVGEAARPMIEPAAPISQAPATPGRAVLRPGQATGGFDVGAAGAPVQPRIMTVTEPGAAPAAAPQAPQPQPQRVGSSIPKLTPEAAEAARNARNAPAFTNDATKAGYKSAAQLAQEAPPNKPALGGTAKPGLVRGAVKFAGDAALPVTALVAAHDAYKNGTTNMDDTIAREILGSQTQSLGGTETGDENTARRALGAGVINYGRRFLNAADPRALLNWGAAQLGASDKDLPYENTNAGDQLIGGVRDLIKGQDIGTTKFEENPPATEAKTQANKPVDEATKQASAQAVGGNLLETNQGPMDAKTMLRGNAVPAAGSGAMQNDKTGAVTSFGGRNPILDRMNAIPGSDKWTPEQKTNYVNAVSFANMEKLAADHATNSGQYDAQPTYSGNDYGSSGGGGLRGSIAAGGAAAAKAAAYGAGTRLAQHQAQLQAQQNSAINTANKQRQDLMIEQGKQGLESRKISVDEAKTAQEMGNKDEATARTKLSDMAKNGEEYKRLTGPGLMGSKEDYERNKDAIIAKHMNSVNYALSHRQINGRPMKLSDLESRPELYSYLQDGIKFKDRSEKGGGFWEGLRQYFKNTHADSEDPLSYIPKSVGERHTPFNGQFNVKMQNGTEISIVEAQGGAFHLLNSNSNIDADMAKYISPLIDKYKEEHAKEIAEWKAKNPSKGKK